MKNYLKIGILIIGISFLITNCQKENINPVNQAEIERNNYLSSYISGEKIPEIINLLEPKNKTSSKSTIISDSFGEISLENILEVIDTLGNKNYSFTLTPKTPKPNSIFNLVINSSNQTTEMAIFEYRMAPSFAQDYHNGLKTFGEFTGSIFKFPYFSSSNLFAKSSETCVQNIDEVVNCDEINVDGGSVVSSGGGGTGGTTLIGDTNTYTGADGGDVDHNYGGASTGESGGGGFQLVCVMSPRTFECDWIFVIMPDDHLNKSNNTKNKTNTDNCCDDTNVDGGVGINLERTCLDGSIKNADGTCIAPDKIIDTNLTGKAECVYGKLENSSTGFKNMIQMFDGEFPVSHLELRNSTSLPNNINAKTYPPVNYVITIDINENNLNRPNLSIARTFIHETIHAEMFRKIMSILDNGGDLNGLTRSQWTNKLSNGDYPGIFDYYSRYGVNGMQHEQMAAHYISTISSLLEEFQSGLSQDIYNSMAWEGLKNTEAWFELKSDTLAIKEVIRNFNSQGSENCN